MGDHAMGLPSKSNLGDIASLPPESMLVIQKHLAKRAGPHFDIRLKGPQGLISWASRKGLPEGKAKHLASRQPLHKASYADFQGDISERYGAGSVSIHANGPAKVSKATDDLVQFEHVVGSIQESLMSHVKYGDELFDIWNADGFDDWKESGSGSVEKP